MARKKKKGGSAGAGAGGGSAKPPPPPPPPSQLPPAIAVRPAPPRVSEATPLLLQQRPPAPLHPHPEEAANGGHAHEDEDGPTLLVATPQGAQASLTYHEERRYCRRTLVGRHLASSLLARVWDFAIVLLLTVVGPQASFALIASYGICVNLTVAALSPPVGKLIDGADRLRAVFAVTALQNACTVVSGGCFLLLLYAGVAPASWAWHALVVAVHVAGSLNNLFYGLSNIVIERDWVVVIAQEDDAWLRAITANLKSIDLSCDLVAPMVVSFLQFFSYGALAAAICAGNVAMIYLQYSALHRIYHRVPELSKAPLSTSPAAAPAGMHRNNHASGCPTWLRALRDFAGHLQVYARQRSFLPGMALAMLYCTVLSFHMTMIAYLMMRGLPVVYIGLLQGLSSAIGILGTLSYEWLSARTGTTRAGLLALWSQVAFLTLAVLALYAPDATHPKTPPGGVNPKSGGGGGDSLGLFVGAVTLSRFGLYMYDVAGAQLFQYLVDEDARAVVGGVQRTLESLFELASFLLVLAYPRPEQFPTLSALSYLMVVGAAVVFSAFACRERVGTLHEEQAGASGGHGPVEVRVVSPIISKFTRLSTITSVGSSQENDEEGGEEGGSGERAV